jgi:hypothetical protein
VSHGNGGQIKRRARAVGISRPAVALAVLFAVVVLPVVQEYTGLTGPRYTLAAALWEHHTIQLDRYADNVFIDRLEFGGHLYSDKAPGQPFFSVPAYAVARVVGAEPATVVRLRGNLGLWAVTAWSSTLPALALVLMMVAAGRALGVRASVIGAAGVAFGTLVLPYAAELYGHMLGGALGFGAWMVLRRSTSWRSALAAGLLVGAAVAVEYQLAIVALALAVFLALRARRSLPAYALGGAPAVVFLLGYQWVLLGSPFDSPYRHKPAHEQASPLITGIPKPGQAVEILFGSRGILLFTPVVAAGVWGLWHLARRPGPLRDDGRMGLAVLLGFFLLQAGWLNPWGGTEMPGPRYMIPALPFLAVGIGAAWLVRRRIVTVLLAVSTFSMTWPLVARHLVPSGGWVVKAQMADVNENGFMPTLFTLALGSAGWAVHLLLVLWAARRLEAELARSQDDVAAPAR